MMATQLQWADSMWEMQHTGGLKALNFTHTCPSCSAFADRAEVKRGRSLSQQGRRWWRHMNSCLLVSHARESGYVFWKQGCDCVPYAKANSSAARGR